MMKKYKPKAIIFDADGVVINREMFSIGLARDHGISLQKTEPFFRNEFMLCLMGKADLKKEVKRYFKSWGWKKSVNELLRLWFKNEDKTDKKMIQMIKELRDKGIKCILATNQEKYRTNYMRKQMGFNKIFDNIFSSAEVGFKKPDKEFFQAIMKELKGIKKQEILFWDDREKNILGAKKFGFKAYIYKNFSDFKEKIYPLLK